MGQRLKKGKTAMFVLLSNATVNLEYFLCLITAARKGSKSYSHYLFQVLQYLISKINQAECAVRMFYHFECQQMAPVKNEVTIQNHYICSFQRMNYFHKLPFSNHFKAILLGFDKEKVINFDSTLIISVADLYYVLTKTGDVFN